MFIKSLLSLCLLCGVSGVVASEYRPFYSSKLGVFIGTLERYEKTQNDVVFLLDESGSIGASRFLHVKGFTNITVQRFQVSVEKSRIAIVTFSTEPIKHIDYIERPKGKNMCTLLKEIEGIGYVGDYTHTDKAMREAERILENARPNSNKIIVVLTDGDSNSGHSPLAMANSLKSRGIIIFAVGVADVNFEEVNAIATSPNHVYILDDFDYIEQVNKDLVGDLRDVSMDFINDTSQCDSQCTGGDCCDTNANCYCGTRTGYYECTCNAGFQGGGVKGQCYKCPKGTYQDKASKADCTPCPDHSTTIKEGSTSFSDCFCEKGYEKIGNNCSALKCTTLNAPEGGILIPSHCNNTYGSQCSFKCRAGYCPFSCKQSKFLPQELSHQVHLPTRTCLETRNWTGEEFYCEKVTCPSLQFPGDGNHNCTEKDFTFGTTCQFTCNKGYEFYGSKERTCLLNGSWTGNEARCEKIYCNPVKTNLNLKVRPADCGMKKKPYLSVCQYFCKKNYILQTIPDHTAGVLRCEANHKWSGNIGEISCRDFTEPTIKCPPSIVTVAEPHKNFAYVSWEQPIATDNVNDTTPEVSIIQPKGLKNPPFKFLIGTEKIVYRATDLSNLSTECSLTVEVVDKEPPKLLSCPSDIEVYHHEHKAIPVTWTEPTYEDNSKTQLTIRSTKDSGDTFAWGPPFQVQYTATDKYGNTDKSCSFLVKVKHYPCPYYPPPANGLITCDTWSDGRMCSIFCHDGFQLASGEAAPSLYLCRQNIKGSKIEGVWRPMKPNAKFPWPDCSRKIVPTKVNTTMGVSFFVDSCSEEVLQKMRTKFINDIKALSPRSKFFCPDKCIPENVNITCGSTRIKRSISSDKMSLKHRRDTGGKTLTISFNMEMFSNATSSSSSQNELDSVTDLSSNPLFKEIESQISKNVKDAYQMTSVPDSKMRIDVQAICSIGQITVNNTCINCPLGTYKEVVSQTCIACPQASYQDEESQLSCKPCPVGYTTHEMKSKSKDDCKAPCQPGTYSETTFEPCLACPLNTYQERSSRKDCRKCLSGSYTWITGSNSSRNCVEPCKPGSFSDTGFEPCTPCNIHSYQDEERQLSCKRCPSRMSTSVTGSKNIEDCKEIDVCEDLHPCQDGSTCIQEDTDYKCLCPEGLMGTHCEINPDDCDSSPCLNNATCKDGIGNFSCLCLDGWTGHHCETNIDDCDPNPCRNGGNCVDLLDSYTCLCKPGFTGNKCEVNIYECKSNPCLNNGTCFDKENGYRCCCSNGYYGENCEKEFNICDTITCQNGGTCIAKDTGFACSCSLGFEGEFCEKNIDDCEGYTCHNGGTCVDGIGNATCACQPEFVGQYCEKELMSEYVLNFPQPPSTSNYVEIRNNHLLYAVTVSFFMRTQFQDSTSRATPVSYSYKYKNIIVDNALTLLDTNNLILYVHGEIFHTEYTANKDSLWHHYAVTWEKDGGKWIFYVDGSPVASESHVGEEKYMHPGIFILGQDQDGLGDSFSSIEAFVGDITEFNVWDYAMQSEDIKRISSLCGFVGNVISWSAASSSVHGHVTISPKVDMCEDFGVCLEDSCHCSSSNRTKENRCELNVHECNPSTCANTQPCFTEGNQAFCECSSGFAGKKCEYDVDECLENNGGCEYFCINEVGSYHCECPEDMILSEDNKSCKETSFCMLNGEVYPDGETWVTSCKDCKCDHGYVRCEEKVCHETACQTEETMVTLPGECCPKCVAWSFCVISPNNTVMTFDLSSYTIEGECVYTAVEDCIGGEFKVDIEVVKKGSREMNLILYHGCTRTLVSFDGRVLMDDTTVQLPFKNEELAIEEDENKSNIVIWTHSNLNIQWNFTDEIIIGIPVTDESKMCGLCKKLEKYYTYEVEKYLLPERVASGEEKCFAVFEEFKGKSDASSTFTLPWSFTAVRYMFAAYIIASLSFTV